LKYIFSLKKSFFKTSIYQSEAVRILSGEINFESIETEIHSLKQKGGNGDLSSTLADVENVAASEEGNKAIFIFTTGNTIVQDQILELSSNGFDIVCFLILENGDSKRNELGSIFGDQRVILLPTFEAANNYFNRLEISSSDIPDISIKQIGSSAATLKIKGIDDYPKIRVFVKNIQSQRCYEEVLKNNKEISLNLHPETPKYMITVQGIRESKGSEISNELLVTLPKLHGITKKIQDPNISQELRNKNLSFQVPHCLKNVDIETFNIAVIGDMGNGKSSLINLLKTCIEPSDEDKICFHAPTGNGESTLTKEIKKYSITNSLQIVDCYGLQSTDDFTEIGNFARGRMLHNFKQGDAQNEENDKFKSDISIKNAPHLYLYVVDIRSAQNDDSIRKFGELSRFLKQEHGVQIFVCLTKLDKLQENNNLVLDESDLGFALENGSIKKFIQDYARKADISVHDIFPIFNYTGPLEERSEVKDTLGLILIDQALYGITTYFKRYIIVQIIDQSCKNQGLLLLETLDMSLERFLARHRKIGKNFRPLGFYKDDKLVPDDRWKATLLNDIKLNPEKKDGYQICTIKLQSSDESPKD